ncbi:glycosyltransferase family 4 protein [Xanthomarina sp. F1114]|uniref:glycosyltransferase family 4 protein n=1 Tax=Xanthomarina sp. F1114 TaxID=2996019 RepID=UPI00225E11C2|nr:glycosyltransferase family 4 protein [Xanthomarina sp. F1114]MCX7548394.1 glycosyltransferase family 4 protein [Xanthomarina sp. F1114]
MRKPITFILSSLDPGGAQRVVCVLANNLVHSYDISIITFYQGPVFYKLDKRIKVNYCKPKYVHNRHRTLFHSLIMHVQLISKIKSILKKNKTSLIIGFMTTPNIYSVIVSKWTKVPCVISERVHPEYSTINLFWRKVRRIIYPYTNLLVVQTQEIKDYFLDDIKEDKITIVKNPIDQKLSHSRKPDYIKENIILNVGRLEEQKNQELLIRAFANLNLKDWSLIIIGEGKKRKELELLIKQLGLKEQVILMGNLTNVSEYYNKAKVFAFTSKFEGFPNALAEAMHFGLACISTDCPSGPSELIENNKNGILIPSEDIIALENGLNKLVNSYKLRKEFGKSAIESTKELELSTITKKWLEIINMVS